MAKFIGILFLCLLPLSAGAGKVQLDPIWDAMLMDDFVAVLSQEGLADADELEAALFENSGGQPWRAVLREIYDPDRMRSGLRGALNDALGRRDIDGAIAFFGTDLGRKSIRHELSARQALLDPGTEAASYTALETMQADGDPRLDLIARYSDANDLVDHNVAGAMNGNYMFMATLSGQGVGPFADDPSSILASIWSQEEQIRDETEKWALAYFTLAYQGLSDGEIEGLIAFSLSKEGQRLNSVLFSSFDVFFSGIARDLALAASVFMKSEQL